MSIQVPLRGGVTDDLLALGDEFLDEMGGIGIAVVLGLLTILYILL